jgi:hypothetical protein
MTIVLPHTFFPLSGYSDSLFYYVSTGLCGLAVLLLFSAGGPPDQERSQVTLLGPHPAESAWSVSGWAGPLSLTSA